MPESEEIHKQYLIVTDINNIQNTDNCYGYWQTYIFDSTIEEYKPIYERFIFYKGKFFDNLESKPWNEESVEKVRLLSKYFNRNNEPICIFRHEQDL